MSADETSAQRVGTTLRDKWVLERLLGVGGMASVYVARHKIGRLEAIKILHPQIARSAELRARFEQEARAVNAFQHPGVVEVRDVDVTEQGEPFLVMELLEGESLADRVRNGPPIDVAEAVRIASAVLDVLAAAHERQIIHRDIKPDNLFLTRSGSVKVLDFGIARVRSEGGQRMATQAGVTLGTVAYMPPEQARGLEIDPRADLYAVGATLFRLLSGRRVHDASNDAELVSKTMSQPAPSLTSVASTIPANVAAVVDRSLAFDRADRYPDARTMRADLEAAGRGEAPPYASAAPPLAVHLSAVARAAENQASGAGNDARDAATFVPPAKQGPSSPPASMTGMAATEQASPAYGSAPTVAAPAGPGQSSTLLPARTAPMGFAPTAPAPPPAYPPPGNAPTMVSARPGVVPSAEPTLLSGPAPANAPPSRRLVYVIAAVAIVLMGGLLVVLFSLRSGDRGAGADGGASSSAEPASTSTGAAPTSTPTSVPTARPSSTSTTTATPSVLPPPPSPTPGPSPSPSPNPTPSPTPNPTPTPNPSPSPTPPSPTPTPTHGPAPAPTPSPAKPGKGKHGH